MKRVVLILAAVMALAACGPGVWMDKEEYKLRAVVNRSALEGHVFLLSGSFEEQDYFLAYLESPNGAIRMRRFPSNCVVIYEFDDTERAPTVIRLRLKGGMNAGREGWRFHVPAGSIRPVINLMGGFE